MKSLYAKDVSGNIRLWTIEALESGLVIRHGVKGGKMQEKVERIKVGKVNRTKEEQIALRINSRINAQFDKGYTESLFEAQNNSRSNMLGLKMPMLAQPIKKVKNIKYPAYYQHKYDGNRCMMHNNGEKIIVYSRNGKLISTLGHITSGMNIPEGYTLDGEIYCHNTTLQRICSWVKAYQEGTLKLEYRVYDIAIDLPYRERLGLIEALSLGDYASVVPTVRVDDEEALDGLFESSIVNNYEGGILRWSNKPYEDGKRSMSLAKIKAFDDDEFEVVDIIPSKDGWARLVLVTEAGDRFTVTAPGTFEEKELILHNAEEYIGRKVNVKFANYTDDNIPFHPVATMFRDKDKE